MLKKEKDSKPSKTISGMSEKNPTIVKNHENGLCVTWNWCNVAAKESGLECTCVNNDDFTY